MVAPAGAIPASPEAAESMAAPAQAMGSVPNLGDLGWQRVFDENFDGGSLDESLWHIQEGAGVSPATNTRDAITVADGKLTINTYTAGGVDYTGEVRTGELGRGTTFFAAYGYIEAQINLHTRPGTRSAFWMLSPTWHKSPFGDPAAAGPEFDIMEIFGDRPEGINVGKHWDGFDEDHKRDTEIRTPHPALTVPIQDNDHVYSLLWTPDGYRAYIDGVEVYRSTDAITYSPEYFILSGYAFNDGRYGGRPTGGYGAKGASTNATMAVEYVRMWQRPISEIPDQTFPANSPVSIPFSVQDYFYPAENRSEPGSVRVSASVVSGATVVPDVNVLVSGNGPANPDGELDNRSFEEPLTPRWSVASGAPPTLDGTPHSGEGALKLTQAGGRVTQAIGGLEPNTTYIAGSWFNFDAADDGAAAVDWGIDVTGGPDPEEVRASVALDAGTGPGDWRWSSVVFTTGPTTTQVTMYIDNWVHRSGARDSDVSVDDVWLQPMVPPNRTLTVRPALNTAGSATIRLTATAAGGTTIGTEDVTLTFTRGSSFTNGGFETVSLGSGWDLTDGAPGKGSDIVVDDPFRLDRALELGNGAIGAAGQLVRNLQPNTTYRLEVTGRVTEELAAGEEGLRFAFLGLTGTDPCAVAASCEIRTTTWSSPPKRIEFTTNATGVASVTLADWDPDNGASLVDDVKLTPLVSGTPIPPVVAPSLTTLGEQRIPSSAPHTIFFNQAGATVTAVRSNNPALVPARNLAHKVSANSGIVSVTPVPDRTGTAELTISYTDGSGAHEQTVSIVVTDHHLVNPGFEQGVAGWQGASVTTTERHTGTSALQVNGTTPATQRLTWLPYHTTFTLSGWGRAGARMTLRRNGTDVGSVQWTGTGWTQQRITFTTQLCTGCLPNGLRPTNELWEVVTQDINTGDSAAAFVDDLALTYAPAASSIQNLSLHVGQTGHTDATRTRVWVGRLPNNAHATPGVVSFSSSNPTVMPVANLRAMRGSATQPGAWFVSAASAGVPGSSTVTLTLTDPLTGLQAQRSFLVTVNTGTQQQM
jgi:beta-glucanase (GH16 family)